MNRWRGQPNERARWPTHRNNFIVSHGIIEGKGLQFLGTNFVDKTLNPPESTYKTTFLVLSRIWYKICTRAWSPSPLIVPWKTMNLTKPAGVCTRTELKPDETTTRIEVISQLHPAGTSRGGLPNVLKTFSSEDERISITSMLCAAWGVCPPRQQPPLHATHRSQKCKPQMPQVKANVALKVVPIQFCSERNLQSLCSTRVFVASPRGPGAKADPGTPQDPTVGNRAGPYEVPVPGRNYPYPDATTRHQLQQQSVSSSTLSFRNMTEPVVHLRDSNA